MKGQGAVQDTASQILSWLGGASWLSPQSTLRCPQGVRHQGAGQGEGLLPVQALEKLRFLRASIQPTGLGPWLPPLSISDVRIWLAQLFFL